MEKQFKEKLPKWYKDNSQYDLILSDDLDSLASCAVLNLTKGWDVEYFYRFDGMGKTKSATNESVGVDIALYKGKTIDNHVAKLHKHDYLNQESINLNCMDDISRDNYFDKYCGSTLLTLWSLFDLPIPKSDDGKMILLCVDSSYLGFYSDYTKFRQANKHYLSDVLCFDELYELQKHHKVSDYQHIKNKYCLDSKVICDKGRLNTGIKLEEISQELGIPIELPDGTFYKYKQFSNCKMPLDKNKRYTTKLEDIIENPFSLALTGRDFLNYSVKIERN